MTTLYSNIADILILARQRSYRAVNRTMIEAYPLAGVLGTILAIGSALQGSDAAQVGDAAQAATATIASTIATTTTAAAL